MNFVNNGIMSSDQPLWASVQSQSNIVIPTQMTVLSGVGAPVYLRTVTTGSAPGSAALAYREFRLGNLEAAESRCLQWIAESGENVDSYILLASIHLKQRKFDLANHIADKAISLNVSLAEPYIIKALVHKESRRLSDAINFFRIAAQLRPDSSEPFIGLANCHLDLNDLPSAIRFCHLALTKQPDSLIIRYELGNLLRISGNVEEARKCYEKVIEYKPDFGPAWLQLGHIQMSSGFIWLALHHFERAVQFDPCHIDAYLAYGNSLKELKLYERAFLVFQKAVAMFPQSAVLLGSFAGTCHELGYIDLTIETYRQALILMPNYPDAHCNLANALKEQGNINDAERHYNMALTICPSHPDSLNNLANIRREQGRVSESINLYQSAISVSPNFAAAHSNLATVLQQCGRLRDAIFHYQRAVESNPANSDAHLFLGNALKEAGNFKGAVDCYTRAIQINPSSSEAHAFLGSFYKDSGNIPEAICAFRLALKFKPNYFDAFCNLVHSQQLICDWSDYEARIQRLLSIVDEQLEKSRPPAVHPHHTMLYPLSPSRRLSIASQHATFCVERNNFLGYSPFTPNIPRYFPPKCRLRVGYVSSDFCNHPTSHLIQSVPGLHDRSQIEVFCFSLIAPDGSSFRRKLESEVEHFFDVSGIACVKDIADLIYNNRIQILLNLNGYTKGARNEIFALRPSPIQAMYLGYPGTSGAEYIDYIITDPVTSPFEHVDHYSEKFAYMPNSFFIGDHANMFPYLLKDLTNDQVIKSIVPPLDAVLSKNLSSSSGDLKSIYNDKSLDSYIQFHIEKRVKECQGCRPSGEAVPDPKAWKLDRSFYGLPRGFFVFCNFNQLYKLDPNTFSCWCRILSRVPNSVLWLLRFPKAGENNLRKEAQKYGIEDCRLIFTDVAGKEEHVRRGQLADVCLDTPLCNGHTTGMDVLWAGCPIVTMPLNSFASRVGSSILSAIGCPELIAQSYSEYEELAVRLGTDQSFFKKIKKKVWLNRMTSSLFNVNQYVKDFDNLLLKIWSSFTENKKPTHITLSSS